MHFCFSSMSYNLIRNFWCVAGYLNIKIFRWSHWISRPCEIPWDVSCCLSVSPAASPLPRSPCFPPSLHVFSLSLLSCISISARTASGTRRLFFLFLLLLRLLLARLPPSETMGSWRTSGNLNGCQCAWVCERSEWRKSERGSLSGPKVENCCVELLSWKQPDEWQWHWLPVTMLRSVGSTSWHLWVCQCVRVCVLQMPVLVYSGSPSVLIFIYFFFPEWEKLINNFMLRSYITKVTRLSWLCHASFEFPCCFNAVRLLWHIHFMT